MIEFPAGTVTFLFTDIEGSTQLLQQLGADRYGQVLSAQRVILRAAFKDHNGREIDTQGDAFFVSFPRATEAVAAVVLIQHTLMEHEWPEGVEVRLRMGLHTGEPWLIEEGYVGMDVHRAARIGHVGHGGQVLLSETTTPLVRDELPEGVSLLDLGRHRLKDMRRPEHIHQLAIDGLPVEFAPLNSMELVAEPGMIGGEAGLRVPREVGFSPYRGLLAFQEEDVAFFFGRETFTDQLSNALHQGNLVAVVVGSSGSGKSSTVFAGLLPRLRAEGEWLILSFRPGTHPFHALSTALLPALEPDIVETESIFATQKIAAGLRTGEISLSHTITRLLNGYNEASRLLLIIDQFEELYTLCPDPETRQTFTDELLAAVEAGAERRPNPVSILVTLRADFMGQALTNRPFADALQEGSLLLGPMNRGELQAAIEKPAELQGAVFEPGLVSRILDDVGEEPGNLPLLEFALTLLWDQMEEGWMTHQVYDDIGRVEGALARYADEFYNSLKPAEQEQVRRTFIQLVQPGQGTEDTRRVAGRADLVRVDWGLVQHLADQRLVVTGVDESGNETVEVVHEALIRGWGQLRAWMAADREFRSWQEGLRVALRGWEHSSRDEGALLRGAPLVQAEEWLDRRGDEISQDERVFIHASVGLSERQAAERDRRRRLLIGGLAVGFLVAIVLSIFAFSQRNAAERNATLAIRNAATAEAESFARATQQSIAEAETVARAAQQVIAENERERAEAQAAVSFSRELAAAAVNNLDQDPELSILLALQGIEVAHTNEALDALHQAIQATRVRSRWDAPGRAGFVSYSPDGARLLTSGPDGAMMFDTTTGEPLYILPIEQFVSRTSFSLDSTLVVTSNDDGTVSAWEVETGVEVLTFEAHDTWVQHAVFSPTGDRLATVSGDGTVKLWDWEATLATREGVILQTFTGNDVLNYASFSPDGALLATSGGTVKVWDTVSGEELISLDAESSDVTFSPDGEYLVTGSNFGTLDVWDAKDGRQLSSTYAHGGDNIQAVIFSPDGDLLMSASNDATARIWRFAPSGLEELIVLAGHDGWVIIPAFSPDGRYVATSGLDATVRLWDISPAGSQELGIYFGHQERNSQVVFSLDDAQLFTAGFDGLVRSIDADSGLEIFSTEAHQDLILGFALSPDGKFLATASEDGTAKILDSASGEEVLALAGHEVQEGGFFRGAMAVAFSPDSQRLVTVAVDGLGKVWDAVSGEALFTLTGHEQGINAVAFSPDGGLIATAADDSTIRIWDAANGNFLFAFASERGEKWGVSFSPDGSHLVSGDSNGQLEIWQIPEDPWDAPRIISEPILVIGSNAGWLTNMNYSPDGSQIAVPGTSGFVELRNTETGELLQSFVHPSGVANVSFSSDGKRLATGGFDGITRIFALDLDELIELGESRLTRSMTEEECQIYLHVEACPADP